MPTCVGVAARTAYVPANATLMSGRWTGTGQPSTRCAPWPHRHRARMSTGHMATTSLMSRVNELGPWFHNLRLGESEAVQTAPDHPLGDFPSNFWQFFKHAVPEDLTGQSVLDIG